MAENEDIERDDERDDELAGELNGDGTYPTLIVGGAISYSILDEQTGMNWWGLGCFRCGEGR